MAAVAIRGTTYPVVLPKLKDPRLHLAATITSLQVIGQVGFHFRVSIAQILICLFTCAVLEVGIAARRQHVLLWPASALLTGNGVAFVLRVPGTRRTKATPLPVSIALAGHMITCCRRIAIATSSTAQVPIASRICAIERSKWKPIWPMTCSEKIGRASCRERV